MHRGIYTVLGITAMLLVILAVSAVHLSPPLTQVRFAVIGDYGWDSAGEAKVAGLISSMSPDLILTVGDNNCPDGTARTIDRNIGKYYHDYIFPYKGTYGKGSDVNRFFPTLGNHDWESGNITPYLAYFSLPGNERYYDFVWGPVHFFALDSDTREPDGVEDTSLQADWLKEKLKAASETWKIVYFHKSPYSSGTTHGSTPYMQWPYREWGATAVISGDEHDYERLTINDTPYFVNGIGGGSIYNFGDPVPGSVFRYNGDYGAMLVTADTKSIKFVLYDHQGSLIDDYTISVNPLSPHSPPPSDPDSDGFYEDLNGNGRQDFQDMVLFFEYMDWIAVNEPLAWFDFNANGRIDFNDIVRLFDEM